MRCVFSDSRRQIRLENEGPLALGISLRPRFSVFRGLQNLASDLLHAVLPADCRICGGPMLGLRPVRVCDACVESVRLRAHSAGELCSHCGDALGMESARFAASLGAHECTACRMNPPAYRRAVAFAPYDNEMREMLHALKFGQVQRIAESLLSGWLAEAISQLEAEIRGETTAGLLVVPVPLFGARQKERGYNQAELLARSAVRRLRKVHPDWPLHLHPAALRRVRDTKAMFQLRPDQRRRNLVGAFQAGDPALLQGRDVLLVDDILTTGATANQCAKVLLKAGVRAVWVATVARAQPEAVSAVELGVARWDAMNVTGSGTRAATSTAQTAAFQQSTG